jgi:hypothetical protein
LVGWLSLSAVKGIFGLRQIGLFVNFRVVITFAMAMLRDVGPYGTLWLCVFTAMLLKDFEPYWIFMNVVSVVTVVKILLLMDFELYWDNIYDYSVPFSYSLWTFY